MDDISVFFNTHGLNIITLLLVLVSLFKDQLRALVQRRIDQTTQREDQEANIEAKAWARVFQNGLKANGYVERLLLQQEHHLTAMRERDTHIERFTTVAVEAVRDAVAVMETMVTRQERTDKKAIKTLDALVQAMGAQREHTAAIGTIVSLYLHDRQGVTWEELLVAVRKGTDENNQVTTNRED